MVCGMDRLFTHVEFTSSSTEDLLVPNPNHAPTVLVDSSGSGSEEGDED